MKLTKYGHACFVLELEGQKVIVDPGVFTELPDDIGNVAAVAITHVHSDHFNPESLDKIKAASPDVVFYGAREVVTEYPGVIEPARGHTYMNGPFELRFYGDLHEMARPGKPQVANLGVCVNSLVAYPGDSYAQAGKRVKVIMAPSSAPWLHISAAYAFVFNAQADITIPTHDALLSEIGQRVYDAHLKEAAEQAGSQYRRLAIGESIEISS